LIRARLRSRLNASTERRLTPLGARLIHH